MHSNTPSPFRAEMTRWAEENIPEGPGFYILHFERDIGAVGSETEAYNPVGMASHYCGSAKNLRARFLQHLGGHGAGGARLPEVANEEGIRFWMSRALETETEAEARAYESYFKTKFKNSRRVCPCCGAKRDLPCPHGK